MYCCFGLTKLITLHSDSIIVFPLQDEVILNGNLHFPNIELSQNVLTFGCIPLDSDDHKEVVMVNSTPLPLKYSFSWDPESITIAYFEHEVGMFVSYFLCKIFRSLIACQLYYNAFRVVLKT